MNEHGKINYVEFPARDIESTKRFFSAAFGSPRYATDKVENWLDVARDTKKIPGEKPGVRLTDLCFSGIAASL